jgi:hypothetical protein
MNFTMRPITENGVRKFTLGNGLDFAVDVLNTAPNDLRRRWDVAMSHLERGDNVSDAIKVLTRETVEHLWNEIVMRAAHRAPRSALDIGQE